jgi:hypothetical protein
MSSMLLRATSANSLINEPSFSKSTGSGLPRPAERLALLQKNLVTLCVGFAYINMHIGSNVVISLHYFTVSTGSKFHYKTAPMSSVRFWVFDVLSLLRLTCHILWFRWCCTNNRWRRIFCLQHNVGIGRTHRNSTQHKCVKCGVGIVESSYRKIDRSKEWVSNGWLMLDFRLHPLPVNVRWLSLQNRLIDCSTMTDNQAHIFRAHICRTLTGASVFCAPCSSSC